MVHELMELEDREKMQDLNYRETAGSLNEQIQQLQKEMTDKDQKCMIMQEELRKQEILAKERQTQIEELKQ
jgi:hypothetical protein